MFYKKVILLALVLTHQTITEWRLCRYILLMAETYKLKYFNRKVYQTYVFNTSIFNPVTKCVGLSADNTNKKFEGSQGMGKNNLFSKLTSLWDKAIDYVAHIFNNCIQNATYSLPMDVCCC